MMMIMMTIKDKEWQAGSVCFLVIISKEQSASLGWKKPKQCYLQSSDM